jgi:hypothetical protein
MSRQGLKRSSPPSEGISRPGASVFGGDVAAGIETVHAPAQVWLPPVGLHVFGGDVAAGIETVHRRLSSSRRY